MVTTRGSDGTARKRHYKEVDSSPELSVGDEEEADEDALRGNSSSAEKLVADAAASPPPRKQQQRQQQIKKRPYRRTKRPLGYNDKSSITTTTETFQPVSAYDAVLQESQDLLQAAAEAQQLGRLKMSASYLLLLHTRLVGLGKRFDKAVAVAQRGADEQSSTLASPGTQRLQQRAAKEALQSFLPQQYSDTIELDTAMMEHLARAAAELHHQRTGKPLHARKFVSSPATATEFLANTANQKGVTNAATVTGVARAVAAIERKEAQFWHANVSANVKAANAAAAAPSQNSSPAAAAGSSHGKDDADADADDDDTEAAAAALKERLAPHQHHRNKPATVAMRTVPHANCDARSLLHGAPFYEKGNDNSNNNNNNNEQQQPEAAIGDPKLGDDDGDDESEDDDDEQPPPDDSAVGWAAAAASPDKDSDDYEYTTNNNNNANRQSSPESPPGGASAPGGGGVAGQVTQTAVV